MEAGQGKIDLSFKKSVIQKEPIEPSQTDTPGIHFINLQPKITWPKKPLPTRVPEEGQHAGIVFRKYEIKVKDKNYGYKSHNHFGIYVPGIGFGAGGIVRTGDGAVLVGISSSGMLTSISLLWIIMLLVVTSIIWIVRHCVGKSNERTKDMRKTSSGNWIEDVVEKDRQSYKKDLPLLDFRGPQQIVTQNNKRSLMSADESMQSPDISISNYSSSIKNVFAKFPKDSSLKAVSTASFLSCSSTLVGSGIYGLTSFSPAQFTMRINQVTVCLKTGVIFTVSEKKCPNSYLQENLDPVKVCQPSNFFECAEVLLMYNEMILVGKMKNNCANVTAPYVVKTWSTVDGTIYNTGYDLVTCISMCTIRDNYLLILNIDTVSVLQLPEHKCISQIKCPLLSTNLQGVSISMQSTSGMDHIVITELWQTNLSIYVFNFEHICKRSSMTLSKTHYKNVSSSALVSSSQIIVALHSTEIISWNFLDNSEDVWQANIDQDIQRFLTSPTEKLVLIQFAQSMSVYQIDGWEHLFNISVPSEQVCAMAFSLEGADNSLFVVALDDGSIQIYDNKSCQLRQTEKINIPVAFLMFDEEITTLLTMSDRASHYRLNVFPVS